MTAGGDDWEIRALCRREDPELFFGDDPDAARRVCWVCPVRRPCLDAALSRRERYGVWGGLDLDERDAVLAARTADGDDLADVGEPLDPHAPDHQDRATVVDEQGRRWQLTDAGVAHVRARATELASKHAGTPEAGDG